MKKCRITKNENGFAVRGTNFLNHCDADMYAYYLANTLNNGGKLIYIASVDEAIENTQPVRRSHQCRLVTVVLAEERRMLSAYPKHIRTKR